MALMTWLMTSLSVYSFPGFPGFSSRRLILGARSETSDFFDYMHKIVVDSLSLWWLFSYHLHCYNPFANDSLHFAQVGGESLCLCSDLPVYLGVKFFFLRKANLKEVTASKKVINSGIFCFEVLLKPLGRKLTPHRQKVRALYIFFTLYILISSIYK